MLVAEKQQAAASIEADKASIASAEAAAIEKDAEKELAQAEPAMLAAAEAVNCLSKSMLTELKSLPKPPAGVDKVSTAQNHPGDVIYSRPKSFMFATHSVTRAFNSTFSLTALKFV